MQKAPQSINKNIKQRDGRTVRAKRAFKIFLLLYHQNLLKKDGDFHDSKLLWALGNFSRFIRPDMVRIEIKSNELKCLKEQYKDVVFSAYSDKKTAKITIVAINYSQENNFCFKLI